MISQVAGRLVAKEIDRIEVLTAGGVGYELLIPLGVFERLPAVGEEMRLHTWLEVREEGWQLFGFGSSFEREVFRRILLAKGIGPGLALGMLSALSAERLVRAIRGRDVALLVTIPRIGRKKAEQIVLDLADKFDELATDQEESAPTTGAARVDAGAAEDAVRALVTLGYTSADSERAVREALRGGSRGRGAAEIIRQALAFASGSTRN